MDNQVKCSHILQKHTCSRRPYDSFRGKEVTRSPEEALQNIIKYREYLVKNGLNNFGKLALEVSECGSAAKEGDLGFFGKNMMQKAFEDVAFSLKIGELSEPISTDSGIHIILRTE
jgi:NIMA-interacting peptidyl-prolyl cis-trans isomerase 1